MLCYKKLWKMLIDRNLNKNMLHIMTGLSQSTINKLVKSENVNTNVLDKICSTLKCDINDIVEFKEDENENNWSY
ncbi:helix-turn-helix domain-containing protein [Mycoplasmopsis primatum]|uniref:helix-turn-helix domain-containing protein n=1 Tax=Mycoplasmopsis primatum TaxID=55604 RepID=UPI00049787F9|nr:helix-turn-helix transcriptional regulator [Mycoplasmopsis primatum]